MLPPVKKVISSESAKTNIGVNGWTGVVWITCGLLWGFYQLFGLSFWRHPFTAEDPLLSKWCNATFIYDTNHKKIISILDGLSKYIFSKSSFFGEISIWHLTLLNIMLLVCPDTQTQNVYFRVSVLYQNEGPCSRKIIKMSYILMVEDLNLRTVFISHKSFWIDFT